MELTDTKYKIRCEMGVCKNLASRTIRMERTGIKAGIHICEDCLRELYRVIGEALVPKSIETVKPRLRGAKQAKQEAEA